MLRLGRRLVRAGAAGIGFGFLIITGFVVWVSAVTTAGNFGDAPAIGSTTTATFDANSAGNDTAAGT